MKHLLGFLKRTLVGELHCVPKERIHELAALTRQAIECISVFGVGAGRMLRSQK